MYQALYRKYRPDSLDEVAGQKAIIKTLKNSIKNNKISHAYLFSGPRGIGKTSIAKILAKTINCECLDGYIPCNNCPSCLSVINKNEIDIIEMDAASNNGVDEIRNLKENVNLVPNNSKYKVYIIDEVHMLTIQAFNALLKTLEEPPGHAIFILATTEINKVPDTIKSRCQIFEFKKISNNDIVLRLKKICDMEKIKYEDNALMLIAKNSNGGMRDAVSMLDQIAAYTDEIVDIKSVEDVSGMINSEQLFGLIEHIFESDLKFCLQSFEKYDNDGKNLTLIFESMVYELKNLLIYMYASDYYLNDSNIDIYRILSTKTSEEKIEKTIDIILDSINKMKSENNKRLIAEITFVKLIEINSIKSKKEQKFVDNKKNDKSITLNQSKQSSNDNVDKIKKIRVNNALAFFEKKDLLNYFPKISELKSLLNSSDDSSIVSLILDGTLKIKGKNYLVFVYDNLALSNYFNNNIIKIEKLLKRELKEELRVISINFEEWNNYKNEYNESQKLGINKFKYIKEDETINISENSENKEKRFNINNDIDNEFNEIVKYE